MWSSAGFGGGSQSLAFPGIEEKDPLPEQREASRRGVWIVHVESLTHTKRDCKYKVGAPAPVPYRHLSQSTEPHLTKAMKDITSLVRRGGGRLHSGTIDRGSYVPLTEQADGPLFGNLRSVQS